MFHNDTLEYTWEYILFLMLLFVPSCVLLTVSSPVFKLVTQ